MKGIMGVDIGGTTGFFFSNEENGFFKCNDVLEFETQIKPILDLYRPNVVVTAYPVRWYSAIVKHSKYMGVLELLCAKRDIYCIQVNDKQCKKAVLGNGKATKEDVMKWSGVENQHTADAKLFTEYYRLTQYD